jgi:adenine phosphoribosyltransferase
MTPKDVLDQKLSLIRSTIREVPDHPKPGILFYDITPVLSTPAAFSACIDLLCEKYAESKLDRIVGMESRGFLFGCPMADRLGVGFVPVRKPGKLPCDVESVSYELEYGTDTLEIHKDAIEPGQRVLVVDDLLATGGTASAAVQLVRGLGGDVVSCAFVVELAFLSGRKKIPGEDVFSLLSYDS